MANFTNSCQIPRKWIHVSCKNVCHLFMWNCMFHGSRVIAKFHHCSVLGDCFLIHKSELRLDVVSVKALCSTVINPKFLLLEVWLHLWVSCIGSKWFCPSCISQFWSFRNKVWNSRYLFPHWFKEDSHVNYCHHSGNSDNGFPCASSLSSFFRVFDFCWFWRRVSSYFHTRIHLLVLLEVPWESRCLAMKM